MSRFPQSHFIAGDKFFRGSSRSRRVGRIPAGSEVFIKAIEKTHILCGDFKVKDIGICEDACTMADLGMTTKPPLQSPADEHLRC